MSRIPFRKRKPKPVMLGALHPNAGIEAEYKRRLRKLIDEMQRSVVYWITAAYRADPPRMAQDAAPADELQRAMQEVARRWLHSFEEGADDLAEWFSRSASRQTTQSLKAVLRKAGFSVEFKMTPAMRDIIKGTVHANVGLIKSIPQQYLTQVEGIVMRSVTSGRDLKQLTDDIQEQYGVTRRRAALIAHDQNNKATSAMQKARQLELGIENGIWMHSGGGKHPRPKHVKATGTVFDLKKGLKIGDKGQWVMPGEEIGCKCVWRAVVPGF